MGPFDAAAIVRRIHRLRRAAEALRGRHDRLSARRGRSGQAGAVRRGAGALLDIDHGTFPFVTSSNSSGVGVSSGSGVPGRWITKVIGVVKAYSTRVGGGPFPTEQDNEIGQHIRDRGNEYGTVTRRPRRCGWFDAVAVRYTARLSGVDALAVMLLDVLSELPEIEDLHGLRDRRPAGDAVSQPRRRSAHGRAGLRDAARLATGNHRGAADGRFAGERPAISGPAERIDRPAGGSGFGRPGPRADDFAATARVAAVAESATAVHSEVY